MTKIKIKTLVWDKYNIEHIRKHSVIKEEIEVTASNFAYHEKAQNSRYLVVGRSGKRILSIVINRLNSKTYYVVTARDSSKKERQKLYEKEKSK